MTPRLGPCGTNDNLRAPVLRRASPHGLCGRRAVPLLGLREGRRRMKRGTIEHHKTASLAARLGIPRYAAVGILESLWHATSRYALRGDIGHLTDKEIAHHVAWDKEPQVLVRALVASGWLDRDKEHRLIVHDWADHA